MKLLILGSLFFSLSVFADELKVFHLTVKDGKFLTTDLQVPKGEKFKLEVTNEGSSAAEFESKELNREQVVPPHQTIKIFLGPLSAGEYKFFDDFNQETAHGKIIAN